ncbi:MAG: NAD(P)H-dependent oxidoreductase [Bacillota bacterium]|nr:NAD(P)H-dependent oxidoreductase [Bacillota bacterium]
MEKKKILAVVGSLRKDSYNRQMAKLVGEIIGDRAEFGILDYHDIPLFSEDLENPVPDSVARVRAEFEAADAIWFFNPEYNHFFSGVLKNLLDWMSRTVPGKAPLLSGKFAAVTGVTPGMYGTVGSQNHLITLLNILNMRVMNSPRLAIPSIKNEVEDGVLTLAKSRTRLEKQVEAYLSFIS